MMEGVADKKLFELGLNIAVRYLSYQPRTVFEMRTHLKKKSVNEALIDEIIESLLESRYLDDLNFAEMFIRSQARNKPKSKFAFGYALKKKGITPYIIEKVLEPYDDDILAKQAVEKKIHIWLSFEKEKFKKKMMSYLRYRGFSFDVSLSTLDHFMSINEKNLKDE